MVDDKRLLGKREKCSYMYEDLNMESVAIDLNHDLIVDKRKHPKHDENEGISMDAPEDNYEDSIQLDKKEGMHDDLHGSSLFITTRRIQGIVKGTLGRQKEDDLLLNLKGSLFNRGLHMPSKVIGKSVVTPLTAFNSNTIQIRTGEPRAVNRINQPLSSFSYGNYQLSTAPFEFLLPQGSGLRGFSNAYEQEGYSQGYYMVPNKANSIRFNKMADITLEEIDRQYADGQILYQSSQKFRSVKGVLYQIMDEIEEYELLLK